MTETKSLSKADQQRIAAQVIFGLRKRHPKAKIDVFVGDNVGPNGKPSITVEINGVKQPYVPVEI